jgi:hypothetical protein
MAGVLRMAAFRSFALCTAMRLADEDARQHATLENRK